MAFGLMVGTTFMVGIRLMVGTTFMVGIRLMVGRREVAPFWTRSTPPESLLVVSGVSIETVKM